MKGDDEDVKREGVLWDVFVVVLISGWESRRCGMSLLQMGSKDIV